MPQSHLPRDPLAAHEVVMERASQLYEHRTEERRKPLPEQTQAEVQFVRHPVMECIQAEVLDVSPSGMRLAAFAHQQINAGDRCEITVKANPLIVGRWATVRWVDPHKLIRVFGVQFDSRIAS